jgi:hypothetical protein
MNHLHLRKHTAVLACAALMPLASHAEPIGYPGSTWGSLIYPSGLVGEEKDNTLLSGRVEQGIDWFRFGDGDKWKFNTYAAVGYSVDNKGLSYNNKLTPGVGAKVSRTFDGGLLDLGVQLTHERRWKDTISRSNSGVQAYASWWFGWDAKKVVGK